MASDRGRDGEVGMNWEARLAAVGRVLDRYDQPARDVCLMETNEGFLVQRLVAADTTGGQRWVVATDELTNAQLSDVADHPPARAMRRWRP